MCLREVGVVAAVGRPSPAAESYPARWGLGSAPVDQIVPSNWMIPTKSKDPAGPVAPVVVGSAIDSAPAQPQAKEGGTLQ